jgi:hypothetical protein
MGPGRRVAVVRAGRRAHREEPMKHFAFLLLLTGLAGPLGATAQAPDILEMNGQTYSIYTNPLTPFLLANPGRLPEPEVISTDLWRGYIATWSVRENRLYLEDVKMPTAASADADTPESEDDRSAMVPLFGDSAPRVATWFTGHLIVPTGRMVGYVHMGYGSTHSSYIVITVMGGVIQGRRELDADEFEKFRRAQYAAYQKTPEYAKALAEVKKSDAPTSDELTEQFLFQFASEEYMSRVFPAASP